MSELKISEIIDMHYAQNTSLQDVVKDRPPKTRKLFAQWLESEQRHHWELKWRYLNHLSLDEFLRMYAELPELLLKNTPLKNTPEYSVFTKFKERYFYTSIWLTQLFCKETPRFEIIYQSHILKPYRPFAEIAIAESDLIHRMFTHPCYQYGVIFHNSLYLWFWVQVANCLKYLKNSGVLEPINIKDIATKHETRKKWTELINFYKNENLPENSPVCETFGEYLENLPAILPLEAKALLRQKPDVLLKCALTQYNHSPKYKDLESILEEYEELASQLDQYNHSPKYNDLETKLEQYYKVHNNVRKTFNDSEDYQIMTIYKSPGKRASSKLHVTGKNVKRPKS